MTPEDRAAARVQRANGERSAQGIPTNTTDATGDDGNAGKFGFDHWQMQLDPTAPSESYPGATAAEKVPWPMRPLDGPVPGARYPGVEHSSFRLPFPESGHGLS